MTTIAFRGGVLAADSRAYSGHSTPIGMKQKIFKRADGSLLGVSTTVPGLSERMADWFINEKNPDMIPVLTHSEDGFQALEVDPDGRVFFYLDNFSPTGPLHADFFAIGTGANYAIGAMNVGADAETAVAVGIENDPWSGGEIIKFTCGKEEADGH